MTRIILILILVLGTMIIVKGQEQQAQQLLSEAIYQEEVNGELEKVIELYQKIVTEFPNNRAVAAKAYFHMGMCYEKLGLKEAQKAYSAVVNNYPDQQSEVVMAKERLSRLMLLAEKISKTPLEPKFTKIKMPFNPGNGLLSPDGIRCAFISEGSVWVMPVSGEVDPYIAGEPQELTDNIGAWDMNSTFAWSGDGKWIAFNTEYDLKSSSTSIYIVPVNGGKPQKVPVPEHHCGWPEEFRLSLSQDGSILAYATGKNSGDDDSKLIRIYTIPVKGGTPKELTGPWTQEPAFSPDGSKIAFVKNYRSKGSGWYSDVWVTPSEGGTPIQVSNLPKGQVRGPVWSADGKMIAFHRRPEGGNPKEIWIVPFTKNGSPSANPIKIDLPFETFHQVAGWTPDNNIGLQLMNPEHEIIYTMPSSGGIATQITPQGWNSYPKWSPDNKKIFFNCAGKIASVPSGGGPVDSITIESEFKVSPAVPGSGNDISPDGKTIVLSGTKHFNIDGKKSWEVDIFTIPVEGGKPKQLTIAGKLQDRFPCWSHDGNSIAFIRPQVKDNKPIFHIYIVTNEGENLRKITDESHKVAWAPIDWAPDGKSIAYFSDDKTIKSIPVEGGDSRVLTKINEINHHFELAWSPDGNELAYTDKGKIWILSIESGTTKEGKTGVKAIVTKLGWSPDGEKIAFTAFAGGDHELWLMENFLPVAE
jgi:Tol biopolymer transport system component